MVAVHTLVFHIIVAVHTFVFHIIVAVHTFVFHIIVAVHTFVFHIVTVVCIVVATLLQPSIFVHSGFSQFVGIIETNPAKRFLDT